MSSAPLIAAPRPVEALPNPSRGRLRHVQLAPAAIFCLWAMLAILMVTRHEMWRDEVRALSLAIDPPSVWAMLSGLRGEGHPALWYLILRGGYALTGSVLVLPAAAFSAAAVGVAFLLWRSPFSPAFKLLLAAAAFLAVEYTVVARNYGISLLPIFVFAAFYDRWRRRGIGLGLTLAILANTSVHAALMAAALLGMWLVETLTENGWRLSRPLGTFLLNAAIACLGIALAILAVRGPAHDAITSALPKGGLSDAAAAIVNPGLPFRALAPVLPPAALSLILFGSLLALGWRPAQLLAGLAGLAALALLFTIGFPGQYRHAAIWVVLLVCLLWIVEARAQAGDSAAEAGWRKVGRLALLTLLTVQVGLTVGAVASSLTRPWSNSKAAAAILKAHPGLADAILVAEPDFYLEPFRYYGMDRTYLLREQRFGRAVNFTRDARLVLTLGDVLDTARRLKRETGSEVVILLTTELPLDRAAPARRMGSDFGWTFETAPEQVAAFLDGTERLAALDGAVTGEDYGLYRVR